MGGCAGEAQDQPQQSRHPAGAVHGCLRDDRGLRRLGGGDGADGLHRLDRERGLVIQAADHHGGSKGKQNAEGVDFKHRDIGDDEGNQGAEIAEGAGPFHSIEAVAGFGAHCLYRMLLHRSSLSNLFMERPRGGGREPTVA